MRVDDGVYPEILELAYHACFSMSYSSERK